VYLTLFSNLLHPTVFSNLVYPTLFSNLLHPTVFSNRSTSVVQGGTVLGVDAQDGGVLLTGLELSDVLLAVDGVSWSLRHTSDTGRQELRLWPALRKRVSSANWTGYGHRRIYWRTAIISDIIIYSGNCRKQILKHFVGIRLHFFHPSWISFKIYCNRFFQYGSQRWILAADDLITNTRTQMILFQ